MTPNMENIAKAEQDLDMIKRLVKVFETGSIGREDVFVHVLTQAENNILKQRVVSLRTSCKAALDALSAAK